MQFDQDMGVGNPAPAKTTMRVFDDPRFEGSQLSTLFERQPSTPHAMLGSVCSRWPPSESATPLPAAHAFAKLV